MSGIEDLQHRVAQAEERFGLINAERAKYSERLMGLIDAIEARLGDQQAEIERQAGAAASQAEELETLRRDSGENKLLRGMLQSLLNAIELGNGVALSETMQVLETKISALIDAGANPAEAAPSEAEAPDLDPAGSASAGAPEPEPQEIGAAEAEIEAEIPEAEPGAAEAPEIEAAEPLEEPSAAPELEAAEAAGPEPEVETAEAEMDTSELEMETAEPEVETLEAEPAEVETAEIAGPEAGGPNPPEEEAAAAEETQAAPEVLDIPASAAEVTMIDAEMVIGAASGDAPPAADAVEENLVDEADAVLDVPAAADAGERKTEASSLEDIMRRVSKLVEDEGALGPLDAGGVHIDASAPGPETQSPEPAEARSAASGG